MRKKHRGKSYIYTSIFVLLLLAAVLILMNHVKKMLLSDVKINLTEIVTQNKDVITSKLMLEVNSLELVSKQLAERVSYTGDYSDANVKETFLSYADAGTDDMLCYSNKDGDAVYAGGYELNIAGRKYFQLALQGNPNISERTISRLNGEDIFVISVPLIYNEMVIGTIQKQYTPKEMYNICSVSLFSQQGSMYIINDQGYILINSEYEETYNKESSNYFRLLYLDNPDISKKLERDIAAQKEGFFEAEFEGERIFSAYTPIDAIHNWYLITSINTKAVMSNATIVMKLFYIILFVVILSLTGMLLYYLSLKNKQREQLERIAFVDTVTGGDSYTKFMVDVQELFVHNPCSNFGLLVFDIDNFKYINSFYGFDKGDEILKTIYQIYKTRLRANEYLARTSADHFVAVLEDNSAARLNEFFSPEMDVDGIAVYFSAGLYPIKTTDESLNLMIDKANLASQKTKGKKYKEVSIYSSNYDEEIAKNERIKREVEKALAAGEIIPFFQPKVNIHTGQLTGAEALARWISRDGTVIPPMDFIPACEYTGVIDLVDWTIFDATLLFIKKHLDMGIPCVPISVNFSRMHLFDSHFVQTLKKKLAETHVPPHLVEVELTETTIFDNAESINAFINSLHEIGVRISMDDFGSGYSSLHMLKDIDIDILKIDRGFLNETINSKKQQAILEAIAQMADRLEIEVIVEGVETKENIALMKQVKCHIAQGYFYSKPLPAEQFEALYKEGHV